MEKTENPKVITMLPEQQWQIARLIHFRYLRLDHPCHATIVYFLPYELYGQQHNKDLIDSCILEALKECFGEVTVGKKNVMFDNNKEVMRTVYDGGRPKVNLVVRMIPEIPTDLLPQYVGQTVNAYDYHLNIQINSLTTIDKYQKELLLTTSYPMENEELIAWGANNIESL